MGLFKKKRTEKLASANASEQILAQRDQMKRNGFKHYQIIANKDACEICSKLAGNHFPISKLQIGVNAPPMHEGCKCSISAWYNPTE